jgi:hypothetical protein
LVELSPPLGHESLNATAVYTCASAADLARKVEQTPFTCAFPLSTPHLSG